MTQIPDAPVPGRHAGQPVVEAAPVVAQAAFVHQSDCEVSMGMADAVCSCPKQAVTAEPVVEAAPVAVPRHAACVGDAHQPGCAHRVEA